MDIQDAIAHKNRRQDFINKRKFQTMFDSLLDFKLISAENAAETYMYLHKKWVHHEHRDNPTAMFLDFCKHAAKFVPTRIACERFIVAIDEDQNTRSKKLRANHRVRHSMKKHKHSKRKVHERVKKLGKLKEASRETTTTATVKDSDSPYQPPNK